MAAEYFLELPSSTSIRMRDVNLKTEDTVSIVLRGYIPSGTLILTGTVAGVIFKPLNIWNQSLYLQPGDLVRTEGSWLGHLENTVVDQGG